jgi:hypothetical protein
MQVIPTPMQTLGIFTFLMELAGTSWGDYRVPDRKRMRD